MPSPATNKPPCDAATRLKLCLEEHDGDASKCKHLVREFEASCGGGKKKTEGEGEKK